MWCLNIQERCFKYYKSLAIVVPCSADVFNQFETVWRWVCQFFRLVEVSMLVTFIPPECLPLFTFARCGESLQYGP